MLKGISIVVCCYNSSERLGRTLDFIFKQSFDHPWELIIIDNASSDNTFLVAENYKKSKPANIPFVIAKELRPGLKNAREKGFALSSYDYILFVDDDNWLSENY